MTTKPIMLILSGLPAGGKTTEALQWIAEDPDARIRVNYDDLRIARYGTDWKFNRKEEDEMKAAARAIVIKAINAGLSVVVDNTNLSRHVRASWAELGKSRGADVI